MATSNRLPSVHATSRTLQLVQHARDVDIARAYPWYMFCVEGECRDGNTFKTPFTRAARTTQSTQNTPNARAAPENPDPSSARDAKVDATAPGASASVTTVFFDFASAQLTTEAHVVLDEALSSLKESRLRVIGYTDATVQPDGAIANKALAEQRALAVKHYLVASGIAASSVETDANALCCYAASNDSEAGRRQNRRATIVLLP